MRIELTGKPTDAATAWARLGDTDFLNRQAGAGRVESALVPDPGGGAPKITGVMEGPMGVPMRFVEVRNGWVRHRWFRQEREFERSPVSRTAFLLELHRDGDAVVPEIVLEIEPSSALFAPAVRVSAEGYRKAWQRVLDGLPAPGAARPAPALERALGPSAEASIARWRRKAPAGVVDAVKELLVHERDQVLRQLRAFAVADRFGLDRMETLSAMLHGIPSGVLELYWSVRCTRCNGEVAASASLSDLADHAACPSCRIELSTDLAENVEVVFAPHPSLAPRSAEKFCTLFPSGAPELFATLPVARGARVDETVSVPAGATFRLGPGGSHADAEIEVVPGGLDAIDFAVGPKAVAPPTFRVAPGALRIRLDNATPADQRVIVARQGRSTDVVPASLVATIPEFRRELGTQVLSRDTRIGTRAVALLFTDLSGSTALYAAIGDARAYALVRDHFGLLRSVVEERGGSVVKTIGDAVMASFLTPADAVRAGLEMREKFDAWVEAQALPITPRLNVGVHFGAALAVHTDQAGLDWFGHTVNLAARAQGAAKDGALVLTPEVLEDPVARALLGPREGSLEGFDADLKGIGVTRLWRLPRDTRRGA